MADTNIPQPAIPDDHELALKLHREWNLPQRRSRTVSQAAAQAASKAKALKELSRKRKAHEGSSSSDDDSPADSKARRRKGGRGSSEDGESPAASRRQRGDKASGRKRPTRRPQHVVAAEKAKARAVVQVGKGSGTAAPEAASHVKCFYAGLRFGAWLPASALASRAAIAAAVQAAFTDDGVSVEAESLHVVVLTEDGRALEFPPATRQGQSSKAAAGKGCAMAAEHEDSGAAPDTEGKSAAGNEQQQGELRPESALAAAGNEDPQQANGEAVKPGQPTEEQAAVAISTIEDNGGGEGAAAATLPTAAAETLLAADTGAWEAATKRAVRIYVR